MYSGRSTRALPRVGFPIRTSRDQRLVSTSPGLFAAAHVLHRLLAPRHPPCALILLIEKNTMFCCYGVFKVRADRFREKATAERWSLKTQQRAQPSRAACQRHLRSRSTYFQASSRSGRPRPSNGSNAYRSKCSGIPRKEVIQPQLPLRLPCYDFTPVTNPTFDGSLPCGLGHRLRVLPASVV